VHSFCLWVDVAVSNHHPACLVPRSFVTFSEDWLLVMLRFLVWLWLRDSEDVKPFLETIRSDKKTGCMDLFLADPQTVSSLDFCCQALLPPLQPPNLGSVGEFGYFVQSFLRDDGISLLEVEEINEKTLDKGGVHKILRVTIFPAVTLDRHNCGDGSRYELRVAVADGSPPRMLSVEQAGREPNLRFIHFLYVRRPQSP
jgi:hypothetical protein